MLGMKPCRGDLQVAPDTDRYGPRVGGLLFFDHHPQEVAIHALSSYAEMRQTIPS